MRRDRLGLALAFAGYASWGLLAPVGKWFLDTGRYGPSGLNAVRFALATAALLLAAGPRAVADSFRLLARRDVWLFNILANLSLTLFLFSLDELPEATFATLGFFSAPLWTAVLARWMLKERVGLLFAPAAVALLAGGYLALFGLRAPPAGFSTLGLVLAVASGLTWGLYTVVLRKSAPHIPLRPLMGSSFLIGSAWFAVLALWLEGPPAVASQDTASWLWMALYVAVPTLASFILFSAGLQRAPAAAVNILVGAELAFTALFAALIFGDRFEAAQVAGLALVLAAVTAYLWTQARQAPPMPSPK